VSQRAPSLSPSQSTFSYGASSPPIGSDIEAEYPAARPSVFQPSVDMPLTYASVDTRRPGAAVVGQPATPVFVGASSVAAAHPGSLDVVSLRARMRSDTPMPLSDVGQRGLARPMRIDVPRPLDLTLPIVSDDVAHPYAPLSVDVDMTRPTHDLSLPTASDVAYTLSSGNIDVIDIACTRGPSSVDAPRSAGIDVRRPIPSMGVRPPKSSVPVDVVASLSDPAPPMRDDAVGRPTSVDVAHYPGPPSVYVGPTRRC